MKTYTVSVLETHTFIIEAENPDEARQTAAEDYIWDGSEGKYEVDIITQEGELL
jgi:hypothetical protein